jgi:hypothetical protein
VKKPPHKTVAQLNAIIARLEAWQQRNAEWVEGWKVNGPKGELLKLLRELEEARG